MNVNDYRKFKEILLQLSEDNLKCLCFILKCYPHYGDESPDGLVRSIWIEIERLLGRAERADQMREALFVLGVKSQ